MKATMPQLFPVVPRGLHGWIFIAIVEVTMVLYGAVFQQFLFEFGVLRIIDKELCGQE